MNEDREYFKIIDRLASSYGWSIEYISKLDQEEINNLLMAMNDREMEHYRMLSYIIALGINGKTLDDLGKQTNQKEIKQLDEDIQKRKQQMQEKNMVRLFQLLGTKSKRIKEGIQKGKLEA